ncbi:GNAT family N-acetyltransferase [Cytobacillus oceanisediminis]|uniref:GNAT family N-acetyltransferase n=1 Tax=Cytobacillus TaxID=2675230 RepID=UPI00203EECB3|nr:GNAT family N-acetyltransferase [Cytobacillus oceanisediminis]MCM3246257.1 GNAT family N-acetyltransferase [Cytobacillus oceanisediminis]
MKHAEREAGFSEQKVLHPVHLFIACLEEKTGALGEISLKINLNKLSLSDLTGNINGKTQSEFFSMTVTKEVVQIFESAFKYMKRYNQVYVNEGHLLKALLTDSSIKHHLSEEDKHTILTLGTTSRDMIAHLGRYTFPRLNFQTIRKAKKDDQIILGNFVEEHFSKEWSYTIRSGFQQEKPSIYIALNQNDEIIGFAAFDVYRNKKGYFGPMGVVKTSRVKGVGNALLHHCLRDMKEIGYEYAIIGGAGPSEFYEKACRAVVIPSI